MYIIGVSGGAAQGRPRDVEWEAATASRAARLDPLRMARGCVGAVTQLRNWPFTDRHEPAAAGFVSVPTVIHWPSDGKTRHHLIAPPWVSRGRGRRSAGTAGAPQGVRRPDVRCVTRPPRLAPRQPASALGQPRRCAGPRKRAPPPARSRWGWREPSPPANGPTGANRGCRRVISSRVVSGPGKAYGQPDQGRNRVQAARVDGEERAISGHQLLRGC